MRHLVRRPGQLRPDVGIRELPKGPLVLIHGHATVLVGCSRERSRLSLSLLSSALLQEPYQEDQKGQSGKSTDDATDDAADNGCGLGRA